MKNPLPIEDRKEPRRVAEALAQVTGPCVGLSHLWGGPALRSHQGDAEGDLQFQIPSPSRGIVGESSHQLQPFDQLRDCLCGGRARDLCLSRPQPIVDRRFGQPRLHVVVGQKFGLRLDGLRKMLLDRGGDPGVQALSLRAHQGRIGGVLHERMLEAVSRLRRRPAPEHQARADEVVQRCLQFALRQRRRNREQFVREFPANRRRDLGYLPGRGQPVEPGQ
jgi:hypothetical protein